MLEFNLSNGAGVTFSDLTNPGGAADGEGFLKREPECPAGGDYTEGNVGAEPTCDMEARTLRSSLTSSRTKTSQSC